MLEKSDARDIARIDVLAEQLLQDSERLTSSLENAAAMPPLQVLNAAGRQRMLSQRFAKYALFRAISDKDTSQRHEAGLKETRDSFEKALKYLGDIPLTSQEIRLLLGRAEVGWAQMLAGAGDDGGKAGSAERLIRLKSLESLENIAIASEDLLSVFEQLSVCYEQSMQMLVG